MGKNSENKPTAIVLGGTYPHRALIENLKNRGYYTVLVDYLPYPPAKVVADWHVQKSALDEDVVLEIAEKYEAELIISTCIDQATLTACGVSEKLKKPAPYSRQTALSVTNKLKMKDKMRQNGIPTSNYIYVNDLGSYNASGLKTPIVVKPVDSNSSKGVRKTSDDGKIEEYLIKAMEYSRSKDAIIEEFKEGKEIGLDSIIKDGQAHIIITRERRKVVPGKDPIQQIQGSYWPAVKDKKILEGLKKIIEKIAVVFNLDNTPLMMQTIVNEDEINVIEFSPRIGGGENYEIIRRHTKFDIIGAAVDSFLGQPITLKYEPDELYYADIYLYTHQGLFGQITGYEELVKEGIIEYLHVYKARGVKIDKDLSSNNRIGAFLVKSDSIEGLNEKIRTAIKSIKAFDIDGNPMLRTDIYES